MGLAGAVAFAAAWPIDDRIGSTATRAAAQSQAEAQRLWRLVVDAVPEPAVALNGAARVVHANRLAEEQFGAGRRGGHIASMSRDPGLLAAVEAALATRETQAVELHGRVPVERRLLATVVPLEQAAAEDREAPTLLITFRDLSEQDRLARMRADFVANASHELRTPLAYLKGSVETLLGPAKDDPAARAAFLKTMGEQAERMSRLVDDLLSLSRVEMREYLPPAGEADLAAVIADVAETLTPLAQKAGVSLTLSGLDAEAFVRGDHDELAQVFQNLIQNAIKYGRSGGKVEVRLERDAGSRQAALPRRCDRRRPRHRRAAPAAAHGEVLSRQRGREPREGRHRPGPRHRQAHPEPPPRRAGHRLQAGGGVDVYGGAARE